MNDKIKNDKVKEALKHIDFSVNYGLLKYGKDWKFFDDDLGKLKWALEYLNDYVYKESYFYDEYLLIHNNK